MNNIYITVLLDLCTFEGVSSRLCHRGSRRSPETETKEVPQGTGAVSQAVKNVDIYIRYNYRLLKAFWALAQAVPEARRLLKPPRRQSLQAARNLLFRTIKYIYIDMI